MMSLTRDLIRAVATEEAACAAATVDDVLGMAFNGRAKHARRRAMVRLMRETGCDPRRLAKLWGCDPSVVFRARNITTPARSEYDADTSLRLQWRHGPERAAAIINGTDLATVRDLAAWRSLGGAAT